MSPATKICERCGGSGRLPRLQRRRADGTPDPSDIVGRHMEVCDRCAGSGEELADPAPSSRPSQGYAADLG